LGGVLKLAHYTVHATGVEKSGKNAEGDSWWETWNEVLYQDEWRYSLQSVHFAPLLSRDLFLDLHDLNLVLYFNLIFKLCHLKLQQPSKDREECTETSKVRH